VAIRSGKVSRGVTSSRRTWRPRLHVADAPLPQEAFPGRAFPREGVPRDLLVAFARPTKRTRYAWNAEKNKYLFRGCTSVSNEERDHDTDWEGNAPVGRTFPEMGYAGHVAQEKNSPRPTGIGLWELGTKLSLFLSESRYGVCL